MSIPRPAALAAGPRLSVIIPARAEGEAIRGVLDRLFDAIRMSCEVLTAKARRLRLPAAEIPTTWLDRRAGASGFHLARWLPAYLRWYGFCFGRPLTLGELRARTGGGAG
jgi:hypothetical protein